MSKIAIAVDTASNISLEKAREEGLYLLPFAINMGDDTLLDLIEISPKELYEGMDKVLPRTGVPGPAYVEDFLKDILKDHDEIIFITISDQLSGMYNLLSLVAKELSDKIHIVDTRAVGMTNAFIAIKAKEMVDAGKTSKEIITYVESLLDETKSYVLLDTLHYLMKGGRISKLNAALGGFIRVKPLLEVKDGALNIVSKERGTARARKAFLARLIEDLEGLEGSSYCIGLYHSNNQEACDKLKAELQDYIDGADIYLEEQLTSVLGVHAGPDSVGASIVKLK